MHWLEMLGVYLLGVGSGGVLLFFVLELLMNPWGK